IPGTVFYAEDQQQMTDILAKASAAGVRMLMGDDYFLGCTPTQEMEIYVNEARVPSAEVLRWATKFGAEAAGRGGELGTIACGKLADLLVVDGNPLEDISILGENDRI